MNPFFFFKEGKTAVALHTPDHRVPIPLHLQ